jgi:hypothetical protein
MWYKDWVVMLLIILISSVWAFIGYSLNDNMWRTDCTKMQRHLSSNNVFYCSKD